MSETQNTTKTKTTKLKLWTMAIAKLHVVINTRINIEFSPAENSYREKYLQLWTWIKYLFKTVSWNQSLFKFS